MTDKLLTTQAEGVLMLTINRPEVRNAIDPDTMIALREALETAAATDEVRVVVLTGAGGAFCSGADIQHILAAGMENLPDHGYKTLTEIYGPALLAIRNCPVPVIAAVDGYAAGIGCDMALRCDMRLLSEKGIFAELFVRVGLIPDGGGTYMLPRLVGLGRAMEMMITGENVTADQALAYGLANRVFPSANFDTAVQIFARELATNAPLALRRGKQAMLASLEGGTYADALAREAGLQREIFASEDGIEGFRAFMEKRPAQWKGR